MVLLPPFLTAWNLRGNFVFEEIGKPEFPEKSSSDQGRKPITNSTHVWALLLRFESWPQDWETNLTPASYFHKQQSVDFVTAYSSLFIYRFLKNQGHYLSYNKARNLAKLFEEHNNIIFEHIWSYIALQIPVSTPVCRWLHATAIATLQYYISRIFFI